MSRARPELLLTFFVLVGVSTFAWARVRTADTRTLPYQGVLERDGAPVSGPVTARFGLFNAPNADTACVATNTCSLWSDEVDVDVVDGRFSVLLGESDTPLTSAILSSPQLFLGVAFKTGDDAAFTALAGTQEIIGAAVLQPGAARPVFTAELRGPEPANVSPPGWILPGVIQFPGNVVVHALQTGVSALHCTATSGISRTTTVIHSFTATELVYESFQLTGESTVGRFFVTCVGS